MASIKSIYQCPRCEESMTVDTGRPKNCPGCGYEFSAAVLGYKYPLTMHEQHEKLQKDAEHRQALLDMPIDKANSIMNDSLNIMQVLPGKIVTKSDIRELMGMAIKIGEIAKAYEAFLIAGGQHVPALFLGDEKPLQSPPLPTITGDQHESKQTTNGGRTT